MACRFPLNGCTGFIRVKAVIKLNQQALEFHLNELEAGEDVRLYEDLHETEFEKFLMENGVDYLKDYGFDYVVFRLL